jgi:UDP-glucuronate decarboxylase
MHIIVTGGAGFIGQQLCDFLLKDPHTRVLCVDNLSTGSQPAVDELQRKHGNRFGFINEDVEESGFPLFEAIGTFLDSTVDRIFHLACPASPIHYQRDPVKTLLTSVVGTKNMLEIATNFDARILFTSTSEIYGDPDVAVQNESYRGRVSCTGPRACYDEGKRAGEALCFDYKRTRKTDVKVVRIFNTYGPKMRADDGRVVSNFITQALHEDSLTVCGDGSQTRSFCFVDDMVLGLVKMMESDSSVSGPINLGNPNEITVQELAETILRMTESRSRIENIDLPQDDPTRRKPDITLARRLLDWSPDVELHTGLMRTIDYFASL